MVKELHIVFQVLNFLSNALISAEYLLTADEKLLLLFLAKHKGAKGIYPSVHTLARELQRHHSTLRKSLQKLVKKKLIKIENIPGKSSHYTITLPIDELSQGVRTDAYTQKEQGYAPVHTQGTHPCVGGVRTGAYQSKQINNLVNKSERARTKRAPLSLSWQPSAKNQQQAYEVGAKVGKTAEQLITKFKNLQISKEATSAYWDGEFENYLINERAPSLLNERPQEPQRPKMRDWTEERLKREAEEAKNPKKEPVQEVPEPEEEPPIGYHEAKRRYLERLQKEAANAEGTDANSTGDYHSRGTSSG